MLTVRDIASMDELGITVAGGSAGLAREVRWLHVSELSDEKVENPTDVVKIGDEVEVKILRVDIDDRKIGLSLKRAQWGSGTDTGSSESPDDPNKPAKKYKGGLEG